MAAPRRLVLFVEGEGDRDALPVLVKQLLTELGAWPDLFLDPRPFVVGSVADLTAHNGRDWVRLLNTVRSRPKLGAVLLVQDGDLGRIRGEQFCAAQFGARLSQWARAAGAGNGFPSPSCSPARSTSPGCWPAWTAWRGWRCLTAGPGSVPERPHGPGIWNSRRGMPRACLTSTWMPATNLPAIRGI